MKTGLKPAEVRAMTPRDLTLWVEGWNIAQGGGDEPEPMTADEYRELKRRYALGHSAGQFSSSHSTPGFMARTVSIIAVQATSRSCRDRETSLQIA